MTSRHLLILSHVFIPCQILDFRELIASGWINIKNTKIFLFNCWKCEITGALDFCSSSGSCVDWSIKVDVMHAGHKLIALFFNGELCWWRNLDELQGRKQIWHRVAGCHVQSEEMLAKFLTWRTYCYPSPRAPGFKSETKKIIMK